MKKSTKLILLASALIVFMIGIVLMLYPWLSANYAQNHHSKVYVDYKEEVENVDTTQIDQARAAAQKHNEMLYYGELDRLDPAYNGYYEQLDLMGNGIMAYISIPKIGVTLPVFHGTSNEILKVGAGHMPESSLPVGGINTHSVITAHSGMASEPMFTDLELLEVGDVFQIDVLGEILTYEVYDIPEPVLPQYVDVIQIQTGEDLCTLITCTPYGINTHRLLIHAKRIPTPETPEEIVSEETEPKTEATTSAWATYYKKSVLTGVIVAVCILVSVGAFFVIRLYLPRKGKGRYEQ